MSNPSTQRLVNLLMARSSSGMSLASSSLYLTDPSLPNHPSDVGEFFGEMRRDFDSLEAGTCALMRYSGVSWDVLAAYYGVSRQSLHRRMSSRADEMIEESQRYPHTARSTFEDNLELVRRAIGRTTASSFDEDLSDAVEIWQVRRSRSGWWQEKNGA